MKTNRLWHTLAAVMFILAFTYGNVSPAAAYQEIRETRTISGYMDNCFTYMKHMLRHAREMQEQAKPFMSEKHRARYRFQPNDAHAREIMVLNRKISSRFKMINGILYHSSVLNRDLLFRESVDCSESIAVFTKRSIRAVKDHNYALFLASAQGIEKEIFAMKDILNAYEKGINESISESDSVKESL